MTNTNLFRVGGLLLAMAMVLAMAPGTLAHDGPALADTNSHDGDVCIHQPRPDAHQVPCLVTVWFGDDTEACLALNTAYAVVDDCTTVPA